jgi:hypothetical protein
LLVFPLTDLAGIDTYKWQDAATAVGVEGRIPWLIGPTALFGFSPRALPGAQPLLLASAQILGGLGVNAGYYAVSLLCGATGLGCARRLGLRLFDERRHALLFAVLYVFSPVFLRYAHWATGRGFCLAFLPLLLALLTEWPRGRALAGAAACGVLLAFTHKAGAVAAVVLPALYVCSLALPARPLLIRALLCLACASATCFAPRLILPSAAGHALGAARFALTRFGCLWPLAVGAGLVIPRIFARTRWHGLSLPFLVLLPLAAHREMYPSLLFLPLVCAVATTAVAALETLAGRHARRVLPAVLTATAAFALATVAQRSLHAAPRDVRIAAGILEAYDPLGPYEVVAPGLRRRQQIQAYVSGFARFSIVPADGRVTLNRALPSLRGDPATVVLEWIDWLRHVLAVEDVKTHWYGESPRRYYVRVGGEGECPASAVLVAAKAGVEVFRDVASPPPPGVNP